MSIYVLSRAGRSWFFAFLPALHGSRPACLTTLSASLRHGVLLWLLCFVAVAQADPLGAPQAIVSVYQTRSYADIPLLRDSLRVTPSVLVEDPANKTISELVRSRYGITAFQSIAAYELLESRLLDLNGAVHAKQFPHGPVLIPDLPRLTSHPPPPNKTIQAALRNKSAFSFPAAISLPSDTAARMTPAYQQPLEADADAISFNRIDIYPEAQAREIVKMARERNIPVSAGFEIGVQLATSIGGCDVASAHVLSAEQKALLAESLSTAPLAGKHFLFILDTGWPTHEEQLSSLRSLRHILDTVRTAIRVGPSDLPRFSDAIAPDEFRAPEHSHACMIDRSLQEFRALDRNKRIQLVFLPLRTGQPRSTDLFREILQIGSLISQKGEALFSSTPTRVQIDHARLFADTALSEIEALKMPWRADEDVVRIYDLLFTWLIRILDTYARIDATVLPGFAASDMRYLLSLSWNLTAFTPAPTLPASPTYMVFAAAGNDRADFVRQQRMLASQAINNRSIVAVMNSDETSGASTCNSAGFSGLWRREHADKSIVSFPGRLSPAPDARCPGSGGGTSFSTPRLAWITAVASITQPLDSAIWTAEMSARLARSRLTVNDPGSAPVSIEKLLAPMEISQ
jgi:hypothetical protein